GATGTGRLHQRLRDLLWPALDRREVGLRPGQRAHLGQQRLRDPPVVEDVLGGTDRVHGPPGQQPGVSRAGTDDGDQAGRLTGGAHVSFSSIVRAPAVNRPTARSRPSCAAAATVCGPSGTGAVRDRRSVRAPSGLITAPCSVTTRPRGP